MKSSYLVIIGLFFLSCGQQPVPSTLTIEDYFPYDKYEEFVYEYANADRGDTVFYTDEVTSTVEFQGQTVYVVDEYQYHVIIGSEWREYGEYPTEEGEYWVTLKEPFEIGTEVTSVSYISDVNLTLDTYFGKLENCIEVTFPNNGQREYFAPGYGMIKNIVEDIIVRLKEVE